MFVTSRNLLGTAKLVGQSMSMSALPMFDSAVRAYDTCETLSTIMFKVAAIAAVASVQHNQACLTKTTCHSGQLSSYIMNVHKHQN